SNFLEQVNFSSAPQIFSTSGVGIPLDSLRPDNVTYSSNLFAAGYGDSMLQALIFSGMQSHPIWDDFSIGDNATFSIWSPTPDLGSAYAPLALTIELKGITTSSGTYSPTSFSSHSSTARKLGLGLGLSLFAALLVLAGVFFYRRRMRLGTPLLFATRRQHKRHRSSIVLPPASNDGGAGLKLDFIPSFGGVGSKSVRARREPGWKNLEDYDYD
ncbi:hypothetical protein EI94DRAFT_1150399, partial [Lactarius quietus]